MLLLRTGSGAGNIGAGIAKLRRLFGRAYYHLRMKIQYPPVGSKWKEVDLRVARTVQIVRYDVAKRRVRIACLETERLTWAKLERFNGKSGGYALLVDARTLKAL